MRQPEPLPDLRPASYVDQVYGRVLTMISAGEFTTGDRLPSEAKLGELFGVSRPVIRDALARLRQDGLIEARKGSGSYVRAEPPEDLAALTKMEAISRYQRFQEFRLSVEGAAAALAAERRSESEMNRIQAAHDRFASEVAEGRFLWESDRALHLAIADASGNEFFAHSLESLDLKLSDFMNLSLSLTSSRSPQRGQLVIREHAQIVDFIRSRDSNSARIAMESHLIQSRRRMMDRTLAP